MEKLIEPTEYTSQILELIETLKNRMYEALIDFTDDQIQVFDNDGVLYILANPLLGEEPIFDKGGNFLRVIPMYNLTIVNDEGWISTRGWNEKGELEMRVKIPRLRILRPDLCIRIKSGEVVEGSF